MKSPFYEKGDDIINIEIRTEDSSGREMDRKSMEMKRHGWESQSRSNPTGAWGKTLTELNCHLHPLDTVASAARSALNKHETLKGKLFSSDLRGEYSPTNEQNAL